MFRKVLPLLLVLQTAPSYSGDLTPEQKYRAAFQANALHALQVITAVTPKAKVVPQAEQDEKNAEFARKAAECHMRAMQAYSPELREVAYDVIAKGGSYFDAKGEFELAIAREGAAGGEREGHVEQMMKRAAEIGASCNPKS